MMTELKMTFLSMNPDTTQSSTKSSKQVVIIHGLGGHWIFMLPMAWYLNRKGFNATTFGYRSWFRSIEHHASCFRKVLERLEQDPEVDSFDIVAHSMGGIVTRQAILGDGDSTSLSKLNRVVQLGPPNHGSPIATRLGGLMPFCKTLNQVSDRPDSFVLGLPEPSGTEFGIVTGQYDWVIPERSSHLETEKDHVCIFSGHNGLFVRPKAMRLVAEFLSYGKFLK